MHQSGYNVVDAIGAMRSGDENLEFKLNFFNLEDVKKFGKGIKTCGKNFNKINRELLPQYTRVFFIFLFKFF